MKHTIKSLKALNDDNEVLNYLSNLCVNRPGSSSIRDVVLYPENKETSFLIIESDNFLYKVDVSTFLAKKQNNYFLKSCLTPSELIKHKIDSIHNGSINFIKMDNCDFKGRNKAIFNCPVHGEFSLRLCNALDGRGCQKCGQNSAAVIRRKNLQDFVCKFRDAHGDKFKYIDLIRDGDSPSVLIECPLHGRYVQDANVHIKGIGCPQCARQNHIDNSVGFRFSDWITASNKSSRFDSFKLYIIKCFDHDSEEVFYKVGRTYTKIKDRFKSKSDMPYKYDIISVVGSTDPLFIYKLEVEIKRDLVDFKYTPRKGFGGMRECFSKKPILDEYINKF